ncbi:retropepsin-like aspartic protease family protein [Chelatococcus reniformis]|uniref:Aspartic protease n=1 Tax=Chelatococcus reniformis TaxID=1494448 RepID=A0A916XIN8_9HYPH|nr:TIGR02281 family clan AA aspartic protease [Chelatococcus reniformis]GGC73316.1 aspartic protease [Chelatococcus reniformis]
MRSSIGLGLIIAAIAALVLFGEQESIAGFRPDQFASVAALTAIGLVVIGTVVPHYRGRWLKAVEALAFWAAMLLMLVALYSYRDTVTGIGARLFSELAPGTTETAEGGEVSVTRRMNGEFIVKGQVNGTGARFIFDTGASAVVLTPETAAAAGIDPAKLVYSEVIVTANGRTMAAGATIDRLSIGGLVERRVRALVAKPGTLFENLLGMSFLNRLASYEVRRDRLIMRGLVPAAPKSPRTEAAR